jgi:hypothetical protein
MKDISELLASLIKSAGKDLLYYELGVYKGKNLVNINNLCKNIKKIVGIDSYKEYIGTWGGKYFVGDKLAELNKSIAHKAIKGKNKISIIEKDLFDIALDIDDNFIDVVFIDNCVKDGEVSKTIKCWINKVKVGGILCGTNYDLGNNSNEILETIKSLNCIDKLKLIENRLWYIIK